MTAVAATIPQYWVRPTAADRPSSPVVKAVYTRHRTDYFDRFVALLTQWRRDTAFLSQLQDKIEHPAFQEIVNIGRPAIPHIIQSLREQPDFLYLTLHRIVDEVDAPPLRDKPSDMVVSWLMWAERNNVRAD